MTPERIAELFEGMRDREEGVDPFVMGNLMNYMLGRSLEAAIPVLEAAHDLLAVRGQVAIPIGEDRTARVVQCPEGPHGGVWRKAILFEGPGRSTATVLEVGGEPDPSIERIVDEAIARKGGRPFPRVHEPRPCRDVNVYRVVGSKGLAEVLAASTADKWHSEIMLEASVSMSPYDDRGWYESRSNVASGRGLDGWPTYFRDVSGLFGALGLAETMLARTVEVAGRNWDERAQESPDYAASRCFGLEAALADGYLPGAACIAALNTLDRMGAEHAMSTVVPELDKLPELLEQVPLDGDSEFYANDGRNIARLVCRTDEGFKIQIRDQNNLYRIERQGSSVTLQGERGTKGGSPCLDLVFDVTAEGAVSMRGDIGQSIDAIRAWNSFKSNVFTLVCCAEEDLKHQARQVHGGTRP